MLLEREAAGVRGGRGNRRRLLDWTSPGVLRAGLACQQHELFGLVGWEVVEDDHPPGVKHRQLRRRRFRGFGRRRNVVGARARKLRRGRSVQIRKLRAVQLQAPFRGSQIHRLWPSAVLLQQPLDQKQKKEKKEKKMKTASRAKRSSQSKAKQKRNGSKKLPQTGHQFGNKLVRTRQWPAEEEDEEEERRVSRRQVPVWLKSKPIARRRAPRPPFSLRYWLRREQVCTNLDFFCALAAVRAGKPAAMAERGGVVIIMWEEELGGLLSCFFWDFEERIDVFGPDPWSAIPLFFFFPVASPVNATTVAASCQPMFDCLLPTCSSSSDDLITSFCSSFRLSISPRIFKRK